MAIWHGQARPAVLMRHSPSRRPSTAIPAAAHAPSPPQLIAVATSETYTLWKAFLDPILLVC